MLDHNLILFAVGSVLFGVIYGLIFHYNYQLVRIDSSLTFLFLILGVFTFLIVKLIVGYVFRGKHADK